MKKCKECGKVHDPEEPCYIPPDDDDDQKGDPEEEEGGEDE